MLLAMFTLESPDATSTITRQLIKEKIQDKLQGCKNFEIFCNFLTWKITMDTKLKLLREKGVV